MPQVGHGYPVRASTLHGPRPSWRCDPNPEASGRSAAASPSTVPQASSTSPAVSRARSGWSGIANSTAGPSGWGRRTVGPQPGRSHGQAVLVEARFTTGTIQAYRRGARGSSESGISRSSLVNLSTRRAGVKRVGGMGDSRLTRADAGTVARPAGRTAVRMPVGRRQRLGGAPLIASHARSMFHAGEDCTRS
jgi:hypothetical protein